MNIGNYIQLSGRLTADVTPNEGMTFARFTLAKNFSKDSKQARFFRCVIFKKEFDDNQQIIPWDLLKKGQEVLLTGKFHPNTWTNKDGAEHQDIEIVVNLYLPRRPGVVTGPSFFRGSYIKIYL